MCECVCVRACARALSYARVFEHFAAYAHRNATLQQRLFDVRLYIDKLAVNQFSFFALRYSFFIEPDFNKNNV
jgi:hypothetical protein